MQTNRQRKPITRLFFRLFMASATIYGAILLLSIVLVRIVQRNKKLLRLFKPVNAARLKTAGGPSSVFALLTHVGRRSGRAYETPLGACSLGDGLVLPLAYGPDVDWCRNIMATGTCTLTWKGHEYALEKPEIIPISEAWEAYPLSARLFIMAGGIHQCLWVHRQREVPEEGRADIPSSAAKDEQFSSTRVSRLLVYYPDR